MTTRVGGAGGVSERLPSYLLKKKITTSPLTCTVEDPKAPTDRTVSRTWNPQLGNLKRAWAMESPAKDSVRAGFRRQEVQKTTWDVPERYTALRPVGSGAYGTVWWVYPEEGEEWRLHDFDYFYEESAVEVWIIYIYIYSFFINRNVHLNIFVE